MIMSQVTLQQQTQNLRNATNIILQACHYIVKTIEERYKIYESCTHAHTLINNALQILLSWLVTKC